MPTCEGLGNFFFFFVICFIFFFTTHYTTYKTLGTIFASRYLQYILTLTITWFFVFLHVYITLNYLQNTYSRFEKKLLLTIHTFIHAHTRTRHTHTHARTQTLQHHTRLTLVLVCSNLLRTNDMQNAVIRYASYRSMFFRNLPHFAV